MAEDTVIICVEDAAQLPSLTDWIHDHWFDLDQIQYDEQLGTVKIPFERELEEYQETHGGTLLRTVEVPVYRCYLSFRYVTTFHVVDSQEVGTYDFSYLDLVDSHSIRIYTGIPIDILITVSRISVSILHDEKPIRYERERKPFFC